MKKGFTLAEVLITLAIIGVVAALTIPSVIANTQQQEFKTGLRKAVSVLNSAIQANIAFEGETPYDNQNLFEYLKQHMSVTKVGQFNTCHSENGDALSTKLEDGTYSANCGSDIGGKNVTDNNVFYTTDGMRFEIPKQKGIMDLKLHETGEEFLNKNNIGITHYYASNTHEALEQFNGFCGSNGLNDNKYNLQNRPCILMVDVNGDRKPNPPKAYNSRQDISITNQDFVYKYVKPDSKKVNDLFVILITDEKAIPFGVVAQRAMYGK